MWPGAEESRDLLADSFQQTGKALGPAGRFDTEAPLDEGLLPELGVPAGIGWDPALPAGEPEESHPQHAAAGQVAVIVDW